ncbi:MAG TPA: ABC transporter permease [Candidatus Binataceae bacterium]|nr:ABC transporter permease [Candidatus Binataceae bacterium]
MDAEEFAIDSAVDRPTAEAAADALQDSVADRAERPLLTIRGGRRWTGLGFVELWKYRDLLLLLTWREIKIRYKQTVLGIVWAVIQPLLTMVIFTLLFGKLARLPSDGAPYAIFSYVGLLAWNFFNTAVAGSSTSLVGNSNLITKVYFPRLVIPGATVGAALFDLAIAATLLLPMMLFYQMTFSLRLLMLPIFTLLLTIVASGVGLWAAALNVKYRDVRYALPFLLQVWMFVTPIIYPISFVPARWRWLIALNPLTGIIANLRASVLDRSFDWRNLFISTLVAVSLLIYSTYIFRRLEREFADLI